jgi:hypothetical protein
VSHRRRIAALFLVAAVAFGTAGFSVVDSERSVDVSTADDPDAYLGIADAGGTATVGNTTTALTVTNNYASPLEVAVTAPTPNVSVAGGDGSFRLGTDTARTVEVTCGGVVADPTLRVEASNANTSIVTREMVPVTCAA